MSISLPNTYQRLLYLESSGTQWIDTGHAHTNNSSYELVVVFHTSPQKTYQKLFGASANNYASDNCIQLEANNNNGGFHVRAVWYPEQGQDLGNLTLGTRYKIVMNNNSATMYNDETGATVGTCSYSGNVTTATINDYIFSVNSSETSSHASSCRIYSFKIYESGTLVNDFVPCRAISTDYLCMYDLVNDVIKGNSGTGSFIAGNLPKINNFRLYNGYKGTREAWDNYLYDMTAVSCGRQDNPDTSTYNYTYRYYYSCFVSDSYYGISYVDESTINMRIKALRAGFPDIQMSAVRVAYETDSEGYKTATIYGYSNTKSNNTTTFTGSCLLDVDYYALRRRTKKIPEEWNNLILGDEGTTTISIPKTLTSTNVWLDRFWSSTQLSAIGVSVEYDSSKSMFKYSYSYEIGSCQNVIVDTTNFAMRIRIGSTSSTYVYHDLSDLGYRIYWTTSMGGVRRFYIQLWGYNATDYRISLNPYLQRKLLLTKQTINSSKTLTKYKAFNVKSDKMIRLDNISFDPQLVYDEDLDIHYLAVYASNPYDIPVNIDITGTVVTSSSTYHLPGDEEYFGSLKFVLPPNTNNLKVLGFSDGMDTENFDLDIILSYGTYKQKVKLVR